MIAKVDPPAGDPQVQFWHNDELVATRSQHHRAGSVEHDFGDVGGDDEFGVVYVYTDGHRESFQWIPGEGLRAWA